MYISVEYRLTRFQGAQIYTEIIMSLENFQKIPVKSKYDSLKGEKVNINYKELVMQFLCGDGKITNFNNNIQVTALMCT